MTDWLPIEAGAYRVVAVGSCNVSPALASQFRNGPHWHTVWPHGDHWCYETETEATQRMAELNAMARAAS